MRSKLNALPWVLLAAVLGTSVCRAADWTQLGFNPARTACTADEPKGPYKQAWTFDVWPNDHLLMTVQVVTWKGKGFVGSKSGVLYAFSLADGKLAWRFDATRAIEQTAATIDGKVIFGSMDGNVYALDAQTGSLLWKTDLQARGISNAPLLLDGRVYIGTRGGRFACLDPADGKIAWKQDVGSPILQSPVAGDGRIYFSPEDMCLRALDATSGKVLWTAERRPLPPPTLRGSHPVFCQGMILTDGYGAIDFSMWYLKSHPFNYATTPQDIKISKGDTLLEGDAIQPAYRQWLERYTEYLKSNPQHSTLYAYDAATGKSLEPFPSVGTQSMATPLQRRRQSAGTAWWSTRSSTRIGTPTWASSIRGRGS